MDIGCGNKPYLEFFEGITTEYIGCDVIQSNLNRVDIICEADSIPLEDNSCDTIFTTQVIEHVANHNGLLSEAFRILKPGGKLILSGPFYWELHEIPHDYFRFTEYGFRYLIQKHGFEELEIEPCGGKWAFVGTVILSSIPKKPRIINRILNPLFESLDRNYPNFGNTLNYVVTAIKK